MIGLGPACRAPRPRVEPVGPADQGRREWMPAAHAAMGVPAFLVLALLILFAGGLPAAAQTPPQQPFLRIEAGGHIGAVPRLSVDATGRLMVSGSYDKTIRLWTLPDGKLREVLRPPVGPGPEGEINAVALTPDGSRVFAAGTTGGTWDGTFSIYLFDVASGRLRGRLPGLPSPVNDLAVSPDGTRFAAGLARGGIRVWDAQSGAKLLEDDAYAGPVRRVVFGPQNRLYSAAADGKIRVYDAAGRRVQEKVPEPGLQPWGLAVSPDGSLLAVAYANPDRHGRLHVDVLSSETLALRFAPDTSGLTGEGLLAVAWASAAHDRLKLLAAGYAHTAEGYVIRRWDDFGLGPPEDLQAAHDTILDLRPVPGGGAVYAAEDPGWGALGPDLTVAFRPRPPMVDLRPARDAGFAVSAKGTVVSFMTAAGRLRFDPTTGVLTSEDAPDPDLITARVPAGLTAWRDSSAPRFNGVSLDMGHQEFSRAAAALPDGGVLLGTDNHLRVFGRDGRQRAELLLPATARAVAATPDGSTAVSALLDGTVRWYSLTGRAIEERAALFAAADARRWVLFTPQGLFDDAPVGGQDLVGIQLNLGHDQQPAWTSFSQAFRALYAPEAVRAAVAGDPGPAGLRLGQIGDLRQRLAQQPGVTITAACVVTPAGCGAIGLDEHGTASLPPDASALRLQLRLADRGRGIGDIDAFVNDRNVGRSSAPALQDGTAETTTTVPLDPGQNTVQLRVYDHGNDVFAQTAALSLQGATASAAPGRLFVLAIGIDHFAAPSLTLQSAVADATSFATMIRRAGAGVFPSEHVTLLTDAQATKAGILAAFDRLAREIRPQDTFLLYVASHGVRLDDGRFLLIPQDISDISSWDAVARQAIGEATLIKAVSSIRARDALLFLDTCYSGAVTASALANVGHETGRYLLAASSSVQEALDSYDGHNGVFMYAIREAFDGRAPHGSDDRISALSLGEYVSGRVSVLARRKGRDQDAVFKTAQSELRSFPLGTVLSAAP